MDAFAGLILYLLDVTFRIAQQAYPVRLRVASVHDKGQLATLQFDMDPLTPQDPIQASLLYIVASMSCCEPTSMMEVPLDAELAPKTHGYLRVHLLSRPARP